MKGFFHRRGVGSFAEAIKGENLDTENPPMIPAYPKEPHLVKENYWHLLTRKGERENRVGWERKRREIRHDSDERQIRSICHVMEKKETIGNFTQQWNKRKCNLENRWNKLLDTVLEEVLLTSNWQMLKSYKSQTWPSKGQCTLERKKSMSNAKEEWKGTHKVGLGFFYVCTLGPSKSHPRNAERPVQLHHDYSPGTIIHSKEHSS